MIAFAPLLLCAALAPKPPLVLEMVFLPDAAEAPPLFVAVSNASARRTLAYAFVGTDLVRTVEDDGAPRSLLPLPQTPQGATLLEEAGTVALTIEDAGAWSALWAQVPPPARPPPPVPLVGQNALRLVVHGEIDAAPSSAVLYGKDLRIPGRAVLRSDRVNARVVAAVGADIIATSANAVDWVAACGRQAPSSLSLSLLDQSSVTLLAHAPVACAGGFALVPVRGSRIEGRRETLIVGVAVTRAGR